MENNINRCFAEFYKVKYWNMEIFCHIENVEFKSRYFQESMSSVDSTAGSRDGSPALSDDTATNHRSTPKEGIIFKYDK